MNEANQQRFDRLHERLKTDWLRLDDELTELPFLTMEAAEQAALALEQRELSKLDLETTEAKTDLAKRSVASEKRTEKQIRSEVLVSKDYQLAAENYERDRRDCALWQGLVDALKAKASAIKIYSELTSCGYMAPNAVYKERRAEMHEHRQRVRLHKTE